MVDYVEILRLSSDPKNSQRCIASIVHCSRHTIRAVLEAAKKAGLSWPLDDTVTNEMLKRILFPERATAETLHTPPDYPYIHRELARPGVNLTLLWTEYCRRCENKGTTPYMYTQFCEKYRQWARITKATMRIQHKPGDAMQVDWPATRWISMTRLPGISPRRIFLLQSSLAAAMRMPKPVTI